MFLRVGAPVFAGVGFLIFALVIWKWGQQRRSLALRWVSLAQVASALCAGFSAAAQLADVRMFFFWSDLALATLLLAVGAGLAAGVYGIREAWRGSGLQR